MRFMRYMRLNNYLNIKHAKLEDLKDLNIVIGPNNCGKTSLLRALNLLSRINFTRSEPSHVCTICQDAFRVHGIIESARCSIQNREKYLTRAKVRVVFGYNEDEIIKVVPELSKRDDSILTAFRNNQTIMNHLRGEFDKKQLEMKEHGAGLLCEHSSPIIWNAVKTRLFDHMLFCPDGRLQGYKERTIPEYIENKNLTTSAQRRIIQFLNDVIDPKIADLRHSLELERDIENQPFTTSIAEQGSGVKSLICLIADILSDSQAKILLIDEPELGLNPSGKHAFLKFLIEQTKNKQIFLATHDPTFVNPMLWDRENVSVYLYSLIDSDFVRVNLLESKEAPEDFAGYLPHTTSLKPVHMYVEGSLDVYIFRIFLDKYARENLDKWYRIVNKIGIYHLGGDFWKHLLYTIPKRPYTSLVVLDGDKKQLAGQVVNRYEEIEKGRFRVFDSLEELSQERRRTKPTVPQPCPIYCLKKSEIEDYLESRPSPKDEGPSIAYKMKGIPQEIEQLFDTIFYIAHVRDPLTGVYLDLRSVDIESSN